MCHIQNQSQLQDPLTLVTTLLIKENGTLQLLKENGRMKLSLEERVKAEMSQLGGHDVKEILAK